MRNSTAAWWWSIEMKKTLIANSHRRQFYGADFQAVAIAIADENNIAYNSDDYTALESAPDPDCKCE